ncbi:serine hydrolase domain-containing protein [Micromonospora sp. NPDC005172]|uniref:serine hydrolase domain-containing protein n=1 Tax=Micromonospora sp. NPDC005172 TaxID=3156867 RepID=UPI0033AF6E79
MNRESAGSGSDVELTRGSDEERFTAASLALKASARGEGVPGASVAVLIGDQWRVTHHGVDDLRTERPRDESSRQHVTCLTKVLIAYVAMMLVDRKMISLDEPLNAFLPDAVRRRDGQVAQVTLRQLLSHTSGIDESFEEWALTKAIDADTEKRRFEEYPQIAEPGEIFVYSDAGTAMVALLIERLLGRSWRKAVNEMLLTPLGITCIPEIADLDEHYGSTIASGHLLDETSDQFQPVPAETPSGLGDTLGEYSTCFTIADTMALAQFALDDGVTRQGKRLLSVDLAQQMRARQVSVPRHHLIHSWGLGWFHFDEKSFGFESAWNGHQNFVQIFPDERVVLVVSANVYPSIVVYYDVLRALNMKPWRESEIMPVDPDLCVGTYLSDGYRLVIAPGHKHLRYQFFQRVTEAEWRQIETGDLVPSQSGGFSGRSGNKILRGSISPIWSGAELRPKFFRFAQRVVRRSD